MIRHTVMFRLDGTKSAVAEAVVKFQEAIERLPRIIPELIKAEVRTDDGTADPTNWTIVLTAEVADYEALKAYAGHPAHLECVAIIKPLMAARACVDYTF